jgi:hypothetical protein
LRNRSAASAAGAGLPSASPVGACPTIPIVAASAAGVSCAGAGAVHNETPNPIAKGIVLRQFPYRPFIKFNLSSEHLKRLFEIFD